MLLLVFSVAFLVLVFAGVHSSLRDEEERINLNSYLHSEYHVNRVPSESL